MIRCLITDGLAAENENRWLGKLAFWLERGVELVQIRERTLTARDLAALTRKALGLPNPHGARILVNDRADVAIACGAHGVHLRDGSPPPRLFAREGFLVTMACHDPDKTFEADGADYILLSPIFAPTIKPAAVPPLGVDAIRRACAVTSVPILALGGVNDANVGRCLDAGAAGFAAIGYFDEPAPDEASA